MNEPEVVAARTIARLAHNGQYDKNGDPYILHPGRVASLLTTPASQAVAWLHDVLEDTTITAQQLAECLDLPVSVLTAVNAITHRPGESRVAYYARVRANPLALLVKAADIVDNTDPARLARLDAATRDRLTAKYAQARRSLRLDDEDTIGDEDPGELCGFCGVRTPQPGSTACTRCA